MVLNPHNLGPKNGNSRQDVGAARRKRRRAMSASDIEPTALLSRRAPAHRSGDDGLQAASPRDAARSRSCDRASQIERPHRRRPGSTVCIFSSARMLHRRSSCRGTRCNRCGAPRVILGRPDGTFERFVPAATASYVDAKSSQTVYAYHAKLTGLRAGPPTTCMQRCMTGAAPEFGTFTDPAARAHALHVHEFRRSGGRRRWAKRYVPPGRRDDCESAVRQRQISGHRLQRDTVPGRRASAAVVPSLQRAISVTRNLAEDRVRTWWGLLDQQHAQRTQPGPGCPHPEITRTNSGTGRSVIAPIRTYFSVPAGRRGRPDVPHAASGMRFTAGSVRVDQHRQRRRPLTKTPGNSYVRGYSAGAQKSVAGNENLRPPDADRSIDWIVICMHQVAISTADMFQRC